MRSRIFSRAGGTAGMLLLLVTFNAGCGSSVVPVLVANRLPTVQITAAPIDTNAVCDPDPVRSCYSIIVNWSGSDPDGRVERYLYAIDPPSEPHADTAWIETRANEERLVFRAGTVILPRDPLEPPHLARDFHVFAIKAVDNRGAAGPVMARAFFAFTQAPTVQIADPPPSELLTPVLPPSVRITWTGSDGDGVFTSKPVKYKYALIKESSEFPLPRAVSNPDALRDYYAPAFAGWDSTSGDTTEVRFTNLIPDAEHLFVVVAFDEAGAYSPIFSLTTNMLRFKVGYAGLLGPKITVFNEFFEYTTKGQYCTSPRCETYIEVPAGRRITFNWFAVPNPGATITGYRWALDIADVLDDTPRSDEATDLAHWSARSANARSATVGPFDGGSGAPEIHRFYIEAEDDVGLRSLCIVRFMVVAATFDRELLVVNDTRLRADNPDPRTGGCRPVNTWPTAAELDTFLFAAGGWPWSCYPGGAVTSAGLFDGYRFDVLSTRVSGSDLSVRLSRLSPYRHVIWIVDGAGALIDGSRQEAITSLRYMTSPGRFNTLAAYVKQGGKVWLAGGGGAVAATIPWNDGSNDFPALSFKATSTRRELVPGRFIYDHAGWQQDIISRGVQQSGSQAVLRRFLGRFQNGPRPGYLAHAHELPATLDKKTAATDPLPVPRQGQPPRDFYRDVFEFEYLQDVPNHVIEDVSTDPAVVIEASTLDTLYELRGGSLPPPDPGTWHVPMTYAHGPRLPQGFVFSGFNFWSFQRAQCRSLVDFVLQRMWGVQPTAGASAHASRRGRGGG